MPPHELTTIDFAALAAGLLGGAMTIAAGLLALLGPCRSARGRWWGLLPIATGALTIGLALLVIVGYASWDGELRPSSGLATATRVAGVALMLALCALAHRGARRVR